MKTDVVIIGGGPAGMAAALSCAENGTKCVIIERNAFLGGILRQCIHNGFGLHYFKEELTGPEYADRFVKRVENNKKIKVLLNTFVTNITGKTVTVTSTQGIKKIEAKAVVLAMGCRERTTANISLTGSRPAGVLTAGCAQKMVNIHGKLLGKNVVILGSGDIGLIMARRLTLEGAKVKAVFEVNSTPSGLRRNITQCLDDYNIPLMLKTTVFEVVGDDRITGVYYGSVDENYNKIEKTRKFMPCDCLVLSVGLTPERDLVEYLPFNKATKSTFVDDLLMTKEDGVFACGNYLHVHDLVDNVTEEAIDAGKSASEYVKNGCKKVKTFSVSAGNKVGYVLPNFIRHEDGQVKLKFRLKEKVVKTNVVLKQNGEIIAKKYLLAGLPSEMMILNVDKSLVKSDVVLEVEE